MGAQRWIKVGFLNLQPSEFMKTFMILAISRYYHKLHSSDIGKITDLLPPMFLVLLPAVIILKQPNLGTATIILLTAASILFTAGVRIWKFALTILVTLCSVPIIWQYFLHEYQKQRILTFLNPESDPLGAGYNILQSIIAIGSGGHVWQRFSTRHTESN